MARDQDIVKQIQQHLRNWNPHRKCPVHQEFAQEQCRYDDQGRLIELHLCELELQMVPSEVWQCLSLQKLHLSKNQLSTLPAEAGKLSSLQHLDLHNNQFKTLPVEVGNLSSLQHLDLDNNQFSTLPAEVGNLSALQGLWLRDNPLSTLPVEVGNLSALQELYLSYNQLSVLPTEIGKLFALRVIHLHNNQLSALPAELGNLSSLTTLQLDNNPLQTPLPEIIGQGTPAILAYLRTLQQNDVDYFKVRGILVQEGGISIPGSTKVISSDEASAEKSDVSRKATVPLKIFYCYAHEDKDLRDGIDKHLGVLKRLGHIVGWYDREIQAGTEWEREIEGNLSTANMILLLVSADFVTSDYCYGIEMTKALELHRTGQARVLPILLRPVDWRGAPFATLQMLPTGARPITTWNNQDEALEDVAKGIRNVVDSLRAQRNVSELQPQQLLAEVDTRLNTGEERSDAGRFNDTLAAKEVSLEKFSQRMGISQVSTAFQRDSMDLNLRTVLWNASYNQLRWGMNSYAAKKFAEQIWQYCFYQLLNDLSSLAIDNLFNSISEHYFTLKWYEVYDFLDFVANHLEYPNDSLKFVEACNAVLQRELAPYRFVGKKLMPITSDQKLVSADENHTSADENQK